MHYLMEKTANWAEANYCIPTDLVPTEKEVNDGLKRKFLLPVNGLTPIHIAAYLGAFECFLEMVNGNDELLQAKSTESYQPLHYACYGGSLEIVVYILEEVAPTATNSDFRLFKDLFDREVAVNAHEANSVFPAILLAAETGDPALLGALLDHGAPLETSLLQLVMRNRETCMQNLKQIVKSRKVAESSGDTILMMAVRYRFFDAIPMLIDMVNPDFYNARNESALSLACQNKPEPAVVEAIKLILDKSTILENPHTGKKPGVLHWVCKFGHYEIFKMAVERGARLDQIDERGKLGPAYLFDNRNMTSDDIIKWLDFLVKREFPISNSPTEAVPLIVSALSCIRKKQLAGVINWLIEHGANLHEKADPLSHSERVCDRIAKLVRQDKFWREQLSDAFAPWQKLIDEEQKDQNPM